MITYGVLPAMLLAAANIPSAMAAKCSAVGTWSTNSAGFGIGGTTYTGSDSITLYDPDGNNIGSYEGDKSACSDLITWESNGYLKDTFSWGASCDGGGFT
ncbi:hypothetical protein N7532_005028 [Penicillium argentinense]|uniref:Uncharacterized protein n=1 Tax=Penicillium argentinense TaxID=1131581 RepID=A0A9W9KAJ2_9EURO|nr:uncharacterized protein N7532_005028 [Penicillium argentinense]KAJ5098027.1 hypothetical protein N7532_005028 [Penicillium argentinense]